MTLDLHKKINLNISLEEIEKKLDIIFESNLDDETKEFIKESLRSLVKLDQLVGASAVTIARLKKIFGKTSEKTPREKPKNSSGKKPGGRKKGQGNNGVEEYPNAKNITHELSSDKKPGAVCPVCNIGFLQLVKSGVSIRIFGSPMAGAVVNHFEKSECPKCGAKFEADFADKTKEKYDSSVISLIAILHYLGSMPFYRLEKIQKILVTPMPRSVQWGLMENLARILEPIFDEMKKMAKEAGLFYTDDTTGKVLSIMEKLKGLDKKERKKIYTTGVIAELDGSLKIVLYFTGLKYSGENMDDLVAGRKSLMPIKVMSDALNQNILKNTKDVIEYNCLSHGRRKFKDLEAKFSKECDFILGIIGQVYKNDKDCKENKIEGEERLKYHQEKSKPLMDDLKLWFGTCFTEKLVEPNSTLGKSIEYMKNHWEKLTSFLVHVDAPLDNNLLEAQFRTQVLNRKNWLFYKTENGAYIGDLISSTLKTCVANNINPYQYLNFILENANEIELDAHNNLEVNEKFLPWNFVQK